MERDHEDYGPPYALSTETPGCEACIAQTARRGYRADADPTRPKRLLMTDAGREYLPACKRALRTLRDGGEVLHMQNDQPRARGL
jgi:hypothetical protein